MDLDEHDEAKAHVTTTKSTLVRRYAIWNDGHCGPRGAGSQVWGRFQGSWHRIVQIELTKLSNQGQKNLSRWGKRSRSTSGQTAVSGGIDLCTLPMLSAWLSPRWVDVYLYGIGIGVSAQRNQRVKACELILAGLIRRLMGLVSSCSWNCAMGAEPPQATYLRLRRIGICFTGICFMCRQSYIHGLF